MVDAAVIILDMATLIWEDQQALLNWNIVMLDFITQAADQLIIQGLLGQQKYREAILQTLQNWSGQNTYRDATTTIQNCVKILKSHRLNAIADLLENTYLKTDSIPNQRLQALTLATSSVRILDILSENNIHIDIPALNSILDKVGDKPIAVYSITGKKRTGKSFMLNNYLKFLQYGNDSNWIEKQLPAVFKWRRGIHRETTGIHMWPEPFVVNVEGGREVAVVLMDTQGLFDEETDMRDNAMIFAFSTLLSSVSIFNTKDMGEDILQFLLTFLEFARLAVEDGVLEGVNNHPFQSLILLIRDWANMDDYNWGHHDDRSCPANTAGQVNNLKKFFFDTDLTQRSTQAQVTRETIKACFRDISVFALPYPGNALALRDDAAPNSWEPEFKRYVQEFVTTTFSVANINAHVKRLGQEEMTGQMLKMYVGVWAEICLRSDGLPSFKSIVQATAELQAKAKIEKAAAHYTAEISKLVSVNWQGISVINFVDRHSQLLAESLALFTVSKGLGGRILQQEFLQQLKVVIEEQRVHYYQLNVNNLKNTVRLKEENRQRRAAEVREATERIAKVAAQAAAVEMANINLTEAQKAVDAANARLHAVHANTEPYYDYNQVRTKHKTRVLGFNGSPYYTMDTVKTFNQARHNAAIEACKNDVQNAEERVRQATAVLETARSNQA